MLTFDTTDFTYCALAYADADAPVSSDSDPGSVSGDTTDGAGTATDTTDSAVPDGGAKETGLSAGEIVAIVAGGVILLGGGAALAWFLLRKKAAPKA